MAKQWKDPWKDHTREPKLIRALIYGPAGCGKTYAALAAGQNIGDKKVSLTGTEHGDAWEKWPHKATVVESASELDYQIQYLKEASHNYGLFILDTLTAIFASRLLAHEQKNKRTGVPEIPMRAWGIIRRHHGAFIRQLQTLPVHVIALAREKEVKDKDGHVLGVRPDVDKDDDYEFDLVARLYVENERRVFRIAKDRILGTTPGTVLEFGEGLKPWFDAAGTEAYSLLQQLTPELLAQRMNAVGSLDALVALWMESQAYLKQLPGETRKGLEDHKNQCKAVLDKAETQVKTKG